MSRFWLANIFVCLIIGIVPVAANDATVSPYAVAAHIPGADGAWGFAAIDQQTRTLFLARSNGVMSVDLANKKVTDILVEGLGVHSVLPLPKTPYAISTNGKTDNAFLFDQKTGKIETVFPTGHSPNAVVVEPKSGIAVIFNEMSHDATLVSIKEKSVIGAIPLSGEPEAAAADGEGLIFVSFEDKAEIGVVDVSLHKVVANYSLKDCEKPTGLIYDARTSVLITACDNEVAKVIEAKSGQDLATLRIGKGHGSVLLDNNRHLAFVTSGDGTMSVIELRSPKEIAVTATIQTMPRTRTGAIDPVTGNIYLPSARFAPAEKEGERPKPTPGSFQILVFAPRAEWL